jgi:hypothetical protein
MNGILLRSLARPFYERHIGLLAFVFFFMFGIVEPSQIVNYHLSLILAALQSPVFLGLIMLAWLLYTLKSISFTRQLLSGPSHEFIYSVAALPRLQQFKLFSIYQVIIQEPVLIYAVMMTGVAIYHEWWLTGLAILVIQIVLLTFAAWQYYLTIQARQPRWGLSFPRLQLPAFYPLFYIQKIFADLKLVLSATKIFGWCAIVGFMQIESATRDVRIPLLGFAFALLGHLTLIFEFRKTEDTQLDWTRALPWSAGHRWLLLLLTYSLVLLPEILIISVRFPEWYAGPVAWWSGTAFCMLLHTLLYRQTWSMDQLIRQGFVLFLLFFGMVTARCYLWGAGITMGLSWVLMTRNFLRIDPSAPKT